MKALLRRRGRWLNGALAFLLVAGAVFAYLSLHQPARASSPGRVVRVSRGTVVSSVSASGSVASAKSRDLAFGTSGTVDAIDVKVGQKVKKGAVLATLDDTSTRDSLRSAQASLDAAASADTSTAAGYASYVQAKVAYDNARRTLDDTELTAPFAGTVIAVNGTVGGSSGGSSGGSGTSGSGSSSSGGSGSSGGSTGGTSGSSSSSSTSASSGSSGGFITLANLSDLDVQADFTESDVAKIKKGAAATVTFDATPGSTASGKVTAIDQAATTSNNVVRYGVTIALNDPPKGLRVGATATAQVTLAHATGVLYVPTAAVRTAGGQSTVTVLRGGRRTTISVRTGVQGDQGTEITSGLNEGDQVLIPINGTGTTGFPSGRFPGLDGGAGRGAGGGAGGGGRG